MNELEKIVANYVNEKIECELRPFLAGIFLDGYSEGLKAAQKCLK